jgi:hypothetical protein
MRNLGLRIFIVINADNHIYIICNLAKYGKTFLLLHLIIIIWFGYSVDFSFLLNSKKLGYKIENQQAKNNIISHILK